MQRSSIPPDKTRNPSRFAADHPMFLRKFNLLFPMKHRSNMFLICIAGLATYSTALANLFVWDDVFLVVHNDFIKGFRLFKELLLKPLFYFADTQYLYYRPLQSISNMCDYYLWGLNPLGFHLTNILLHIACAVALYFLIISLSGTRRLALIAAVLFTVHPVNSSVVNYVSSRADILVTLFSFLALLLFLKAKDFKAYTASLVCFIAALLSKEVAIIFPVCLAMTNELYVSEKKERLGAQVTVRRRWYFVFLATAAAFIVLRTKMLHLQSNIFPPGDTGFFTLASTFLVTLTVYLRLLLFPAGLHMMRAIGIVEATGLWSAACVILIVFFAMVLWQLHRHNKLIFFAVAFFLIWISPVASLAFRNPEYYLQNMAIIEEHWLYLPAVGMFIVAAYVLERLLRVMDARYARIALIAVTLWLCLVTLSENRHWKDNYTFFSHTLRSVDYSPTLYRNLGWVCVQRGDLGKAADMYSKALAITKIESEKKVLYNALAYVYYLKGWDEKASDYCAQAIDADARYADGHACLGLVYAKVDVASAIEKWKTALAIDIYNSRALNSLLALSAGNSQIRNFLIEKYKDALKLGQDFQRFRLFSALGAVYLYSAMDEEAFLNFTLAAKINPYDSASQKGLAVVYARKNDYRQAIAYFKRALALDPFDKEAYRNLSMLFMQLGNEKDARVLLEKADAVNIFR